MINAFISQMNQQYAGERLSRNAKKWLTDAPRTETKDILVSFVVAMVRMSSWKKAKSYEW